MQKHWPQIYHYILLSKNFEEYQFLLFERYYKLFAFQLHLKSFFFLFFFLWFGLAKIFSCFFNFAYKQVLIQAIIFYSYSDTNKNFHFLIKNDVPPLIIQTIKTFFEEKRKIHSFIHSFIHLSAFIKCIQLTLMDQHLNLIHPILISKKKICLNVLKQGYQKT